jgi:hypothetical protein
MDGSIASEHLCLNRAIVQKFDFPSFAGDRNLDHDGVLSMLIEAVMNLPLAKIIQERKEPRILGNHRSNL